MICGLHFGAAGRRVQAYYINTMLVSIIPRSTLFPLIIWQTPVPRLQIPSVTSTHLINISHSNPDSLALSTLAQIPNLLYKLCQTPLVVNITVSHAKGWMRVIQRCHHSDPRDRDIRLRSSAAGNNYTTPRGS